MQTFRTSYRHDFAWPWALPVRLNAWQPPERTFYRPRECDLDLEGPAARCPDCPCPEHAWASDSSHYKCLAGTEARLHQLSQGARLEIGRCLDRTEGAKAKGTGRQPPTDSDDWLSIYASDYTPKQSASMPRFVDILTELVSSGVPTAPLGRSLFAAYDDPTRFRNSPHTVPVYDPSRPVLERLDGVPEISEQWYTGFPTASEYTTSYSDNAYRTTRKCQPFKYPLLPGLL